jgi:allophanate hydrolase subunit 2
MARRVIALKGDPIVNEDEVALAAFTPGHLLELTSTGVQKNTDDAANVATNFALERDEVGRDIDVDYATGDVVKVGAFAPGMRVYAFLASGQNVAKGAYLTGTTTGLLTATGVTAGVRLARALEAVNSTNDATRIRVEVV